MRNVFSASRNCALLTDYISDEDGVRGGLSSSVFANLKPSTALSCSPLRTEGCDVHCVPPITNGCQPFSSFHLMSSHQEVLNTIIDLEKTGLRKYTVEDVQEHHRLLFPDGQSLESVGVRLRELFVQHYLQKEHAGRRVVYWRV